MTEITIDLPDTFSGPKHRQRIAELVRERAPGYVLTRIDVDGMKAYASKVRPGKAVGAVPPTVKPADLPYLEARLEPRGLALVAADLPHRQVTLARLTPEQVEVRRRVAMRIGCQPWEIELAVGCRGTGDIADVVIVRWPAAGMSGTRARELWLEVAREVVGHRGWTRRLVGDRVEMHAEPMPSFPDKATPWDLIGQQGWERIFLGYDGRGRPVWGDATASPHVMVTGRTGAGKSVFLNLMLTGLLLRGWDVRLCEPVKSGLDFAHLRPFMTRWATTRAEVATVMSELAGEIDRRKSLLLEHQAKRWDELPAEVRVEHDIRPILVMHDELESAAQEIDAKKLVGAEKDRAEADQASVATTRGLISRILREARYVGVHLCLATQRWTTEALGSASSSWRANCGLRIALGRMNLDTLKVSVTDVDSCRIAYERAFGSMAEGDDEPEDEVATPIKGLGVTELEYRDPAAFRVTWPGTNAEQVAVLRDRGIAEPGGPAPETPDDGLSTPGQIVWNTTEPEPELAELELDATDIELEDEPPSPTGPAVEDDWVVEPAAVKPKPAPVDGFDTSVGIDLADLT